MSQIQLLERAPFVEILSNRFADAVAGVGQVVLLDVGPGDPGQRHHEEPTGSTVLSGGGAGGSRRHRGKHEERRRAKEAGERSPAAGGAIL